MVRLKGGDPFIFGRGAEEAEALHKAGVDFEVVPGVTAGVGVPAYAGLAVTHRDFASAAAFVSGHGTKAAERLDWQALAKFPGTLVVYMGVRKLRNHCDELIRHGKEPTTPAAVVENGALPSQRTIVGELASIANLAEAANLVAPALLVVGEIVRKRPELGWFERLPLFGQTIMITRPRAESETSASLLERLGAEVVVAPMVEIKPLEDFSELDEMIHRIQTFKWIVFTSANGVRFFIERLEQIGLDLRILGGSKLAAIGPGTSAELARCRLKADLTPPLFRSEEFAEALAPAVAGQRVLLARADRGRTLLKDELSKHAQVEQIAVYRNCDTSDFPIGVLERLESGSIQWITLTSSAIARNLIGLLPSDIRSKLSQTVKLASLSPVTTATVRQLGWDVAAEADVYTWDGLAQALVAAVRTQKA